MSYHHWFWSYDNFLLKEKPEKIPSEFCPISKDLGELAIQNLARNSLMKIYLMLQHARVIAFTISELLWENQQWGNPIQIRVSPD